MFRAIKEFQVQIDANVKSYSKRHGNTHLTVYKTYKRRNINYKPTVCVKSVLASVKTIKVCQDVNDRYQIEQLIHKQNTIILPDSNHVLVVNPSDIYSLQPYSIVHDTLTRKPAHMAIAHIYDFNSLQSITSDCQFTKEQAWHFGYTTNYNIYCDGNQQFAWYEFTPSYLNYGYYNIGKLHAMITKYKHRMTQQM